MKQIWLSIAILTVVCGCDSSNGGGATGGKVGGGGAAGSGAIGGAAGSAPGGAGGKGASGGHGGMAAGTGQSGAAGSDAAGSSGQAGAGASGGQAGSSAVDGGAAGIGGAAGSGGAGAAGGNDATAGSGGGSGTGASGGQAGSSAADGGAAGIGGTGGAAGSGGAGATGGNDATAGSGGGSVVCPMTGPLFWWQADRYACAGEAPSSLFNNPFGINLTIRLQGTEGRFSQIQGTASASCVTPDNGTVTCSGDRMTFAVGSSTTCNCAVDRQCDVVSEPVIFAFTSGEAGQMFVTTSVGPTPITICTLQGKSNPVTLYWRLLGASLP